MEPRFFSLGPGNTQVQIPSGQPYWVQHTKIPRPDLEPDVPFRSRSGSPALQGLESNTTYYFSHHDLRHSNLVLIHCLLHLILINHTPIPLLSITSIQNDPHPQIHPLGPSCENISCSRGYGQGYWGHVTSTQQLPRSQIIILNTIADLRRWRRTMTRRGWNS